MTKRKLSLIIIAAVLGAILIAVSVCAIIANSKNDKSQPVEQLASWQSMIKDDVLLKDVVIAGAHDAGTKGISYLAATQDRDIADLLKCGMRYLDLRVAYSKQKLLIYHGPFKGMSLESVIDDVKQFLVDNTSENIILDFQHFEENDTEAQNETIKLVDEQLKEMLVINLTDKSDVEFVDSLTMGDVRGKCLIVWGRTNDDIISKNYVFQRNNDDGSRTNSVLHSFYFSKYNKKSSANYIKDGLSHYLGLYKEPQYGQGLRILQGQLTDGMFVFGPHFREATHTDNMNEYLDGLKTSPDLAYINIVIRDFITPSKNCYALQLNLAKNTVKTDKVATFEKMIADTLGK